MQNSSSRCTRRQWQGVTSGCRRTPAAEAKFEAIEVAKHARHEWCLPTPFEQGSLTQRPFHGASIAGEMFRRLAVQARRLNLQALEARSHAQGPLQNETHCLYSTQVPREYQGYYLHRPLQPKPRAAQPAAPEGTAAAATGAASEVPENFQENVSAHSARAASAWMLPWEKRQMDGAATPLRTWEKLYWGIFVAGFSAFLFSRLYRSQPRDPKMNEEKEARRRERARLLLAGHSMAEDDDPFEGLTPEEIQQYVQKETAGASPTDPFEGMSPEEINDYMAKHGSIQAAS